MPIAEPTVPPRPPHPLVPVLAMDLVELPVGPFHRRVRDDEGGEDGGGPTLQVLEDLGRMGTEKGIRR